MFPYLLCDDSSLFGEAIAIPIGEATATPTALTETASSHLPVGLLVSDHPALDCLIVVEDFWVQLVLPRTLYTKSQSDSNTARDYNSVQRNVRTSCTIDGTMICDFRKFNIMLVSLWDVPNSMVSPMITCLVV